MKKSELAAPSPLPLPDPTAIPIPVLCDACRDKGIAGDERFAMIPDILNFTPVPRRAHVNNWTETHQRAFIAALAITGSPRQAARAIGRHQFGAEQLRKHRQGKSFAAAWDAALEIAKEREAYRVTANLADLAEEREAELVRLGKQHHDTPAEVVPASELSEEDHRELEAKMRQQLLNCRRLYLSRIADDPKKRRAWVALCGPCDWDRARAMKRQDDEPFEDQLMDYSVVDACYNMHEPGMVLTVNAGMLNHHLGVPGPVDQLRHEFAIMERLRAEGMSEDEVRAHMEIRDELLKQGWRETENGSLVEPEERDD